MSFRKLPLKTLVILGFALFGLSCGVAISGAEPVKPGEGAGHEYDGADIKKEQESSSSEKSLPAKLVIDESKIVRGYDAQMFGVCYDWWAINSLDVAKAESPGGTPVVSKEYLAVMKGVPLPLNRNVTEPLSWKDALGPMSERKSQKLTSWDAGSVKAFGPVEWIKSTLAIDPRAEFVWCLDIARPDAVQDAH